MNNMEETRISGNPNPNVVHRLLPAVVPSILIAVGYVDPGKWTATIEGGARFGFDLVWPMVIFNCAAILCQYLSARIGVVTGRDLSRICSDEYDKGTCRFMGVQTTLSAILLDLTMILGIAHGISHLCGVGLSAGVFLMAVDAALFPVFASTLERSKANLLCKCTAGFILLLYFLGVLITQPDVPLSMNGTLTKLSGESAFALMSLLGASIMPHNFLLHSSLVLQYQRPSHVSKNASCYDHLFAIICVFSGIYLVNYVLMNSAANVFNTTGLVLLTFPDAMALMEQVWRSPMAPFAFFLILYLTNHITQFTWNLGGEVVLHNFLGLDIPYWLYNATIRIIAIVPALLCVWTSGVEGVYQLLILTQVLVALQLPSSVIPLFRIATSRQIMGPYKISQLLEFSVLMMLIGMLGLKIIFVVEMIFGDSDWVSNLRWNMGSSSSIPYAVLLATACASFCFMLWLAATPLRSATNLDDQLWSSDVQNAVPDICAPRDEKLAGQVTYSGNESLQRHSHLLAAGDPVASYSDVNVSDATANLPKTILESQEIRLTTIEEDSVSNAESVSISSEVKTEPMDLVEKTVQVEEELQIENKEDDGDSWECEEPLKCVQENTLSLASDGPGSFRSLSGKGDESGSGPASLSRIAGLGRAARRQLAAVLDDFWKQLYDLHGQATQEARTKKLDVLLGDSKCASSSPNSESSMKDFTGNFPSIESESAISSRFYNSTKQPTMRSTMDLTMGVQRNSSSPWGNSTQLLDAYMQGSSNNLMDLSERRYSSARNLPVSFGCRDPQPATIHGYRLSSLVNQMRKDTSTNYLNSQMESTTPLSPSLVSRNYGDPLSIALGQKLQNGSSPRKPPGFQHVVVSRNSSLQSERANHDYNPSGHADNAGMSTNPKKYHSLPDISGISGAYRDMYMSGNSIQSRNAVGYVASVGRTSYDPSHYPNSVSGVSPLAFDSLSKGYGNAFSFSSGLESQSIWSKQPYEKIALADKSRAVVSGVNSRSSSVAQEIISPLDSEAQLLQSFRSCIVKLLKLDGSDWLFSQNDGVDEDLIDHVAAREKYLYEAETREMSSVVHPEEAILSVPNCGEGCVWRADVVVSFGVWCIHRILDLSLMESRPELWGKYTYVLNRLQGMIDPAFSKTRPPLTPCFCLQISAAHQMKSSPPVSSGMLPPLAKQSRGKSTNAAMLLGLIKDVEIAISGRKGRAGTAAGDVAFPKGKENLASVLKRYKRRLSNKPMK